MGKTLIKMGLKNAVIEKFEKRNIEYKKSDDGDPEKAFQDSDYKAQDGIKPYNIETFEDFSKKHTHPGKQKNDWNEDHKETNQIHPD